ncbi:NADP-dependent oxidoreductase [Streptomyces roseoverticillatus]|uniref:NADP-dependent oxidoreductase n=1 Tax=Streptomyces roseoverticillatus TaxID=66429 RepID=UPI001F48DD3F|nr:NADP-dependent oxidoreductase [Streptomyces roseoverticillatus]MCF3100509.1 NADP-dependent oxidoreductase [Streptomyces roseoverticillatus]
MRVITQHSLGGPEVLEVAEADRPVPGPGEVLVQVRATAVNPADWKVRSGHVRWFGEPPFVLGHEFSGVVAEVGGSGGRLRPGDDVFGWATMPHGSNADYVLVPETAVVAKPAAIDHVHAAALPIAGLTGWQALVNIAQVRAGQRVLIHGAAGGVGHLAVQIAKARGAHVTGTARAVNHEFLRGLGVDELIDYTVTDFTTVRKVDVVLDTISYDYGPRSLRTLTPGGILIDVVGVGVDRTAVKAQAEAAGLRFVEFYLEPTQADLAGLAGLVSDGSLRPYIQETLPLTDMAKAHELSESGRVRGKIVLVP